jgi:hypothetical protein
MEVRIMAGRPELNGQRRHRLPELGAHELPQLGVQLCAECGPRTASTGRTLTNNLHAQRFSCKRSRNQPAPLAF